MTAPLPLPTGVWTCDTAADVTELGEKLGRFLTGGAVVLLYGTLGAGKTTFAQGVAYALGLAPEDVTSPSFPLVNYYASKPFSLYHLDLYRLAAGPAAAYAVGLDDILADMNAVTLVEWPERIDGYDWPAPCYRVTINGDGGTPREIIIA